MRTEEIESNLSKVDKHKYSEQVIHYKNLIFEKIDEIYMVFDIPKEYKSVSFYKKFKKLWSILFAKWSELSESDNKEIYKIRQLTLHPKLVVVHFNELSLVNDYAKKSNERCVINFATPTDIFKSGYIFYGSSLKSLYRFKGEEDIFFEQAGFIDMDDFDNQCMNFMLYLSQQLLIQYYEELKGK